MKSRAPSWFSEDDVVVTSPPQFGQRFHFDISDVALAQIGSRAVEECVKKMGETIAYRREPDIAVAVAEIMQDAEWVRPFVEEEIRKSARDFAASMWRRMYP